jgi:hypothetical protein
LASVAFRVNVAAVVLFGVPLSKPPPVSVAHAGSEPLFKATLIGVAVLPLCVTVCEYAVPTVAATLGRATIITGQTRKLIVTLPTQPTYVESVAVTVTL